MICASRLDFQVCGVSKLGQEIKRIFSRLWKHGSSASSGVLPNNWLFPYSFCFVLGTGRYTFTSVVVPPLVD